MANLMENYFELYEIVKICHIIALISWLAGLLYLPRIFVYHSSISSNSQADEIFQLMEKRLFRYIMNPAMIATLLFGFYLAQEIGFSFAWLHIKLLLVAILVAYHHFLGRCIKNFAAKKNKYDQKFYRIINEIPTILMIAIVCLVILKPFS